MEHLFFRRNRLSIPGTLLVVGVFLVYLSFQDMRVALRKPVDLNQVTKTQLYDGMKVEGTVPMNLGVFDGVHETSPKQWFVIALDNGMLLGLETSDEKYEKSLKKLEEDTYNYFVEDTQNLDEAKKPEGVKIKGVIYAMDDNTLLSFTNTIYMVARDLRLPDEPLINHRAFYYIKCGKSYSWIVKLLGGIACILLALRFFGVFVDVKIKERNPDTIYRGEEGGSFISEEDDWEKFNRQYEQEQPIPKQPPKQETKVQKLKTSESMTGLQLKG
ncbi:MAG: DUF6709 family protein [Lachnospiraceae bacterium]|nr:DUF6709 family protein [Lachnospiraceae bacterium]